MNNNISTINKMKFRETINKDICDYLLQLSNDDLKQVVYDINDQNAEDGSTWNVDIYIKQVKIWLKIMKDNDYTKICNYKYSTSLKDKGRLFIKWY